MHEPDRPTGFAVLPSFIARDGTIEPPLKSLLLALSSFAGADESSWPSNRTLQTCTGMSERSVRDWIRKGEAAGLLVVSRRFDGKGAPLSNLYRLNFTRWGIRDPADQRQDLPGVSAESARGRGDGLPQVGREAAPGRGDGLPPNKTSDQDQENMISGALTRPEPTDRLSKGYREALDDAQLPMMIDSGESHSEPHSEPRGERQKKPAKASKAKRRKEAMTDDEMAEAADRCPSEKDAADYAVEIGLAPSERYWAEAWWCRWEERRWIRTDKSGNRSPVGNWRMTLRTAFKYASAETPKLKTGSSSRNIRSSWTVQPGETPDPWGGCR